MTKAAVVVLPGCTPLNQGGKYLFPRFQNQLFEKAQVENGAQVLDINMDEGIVCSKVSKIRSADVDATCHNSY